MGRIIRNGIEYGSGNENATNINYDGTVSGLEATTVQAAMDELSESLDEINEILDFTISTNGTFRGMSTLKNNTVKINGYFSNLSITKGTNANVAVIPYKPRVYFQFPMVGLKDGVLYPMVGTLLTDGSISIYSAQEGMVECNLSISYDIQN